MNAKARAFDEKGQEIGFMRTALHQAALYGHADTVQYLADVGADVNAQTSALNGSVTALHEAVKEGRNSVTTLLSCARLNVKTTDIHERTAFHYAILLGRTDYAAQIVLHKSYMKGKSPTNQNSLEFLLSKTTDERVKEFLKSLVSRQDH